MDTLNQSLAGYSEEWRDKMVEIWNDRQDLMRVYDTGALRRSVRSGGMHIDEEGGYISFNFLLYGIYVDHGVGNGYRRGNGGDLKFLSPLHRIAHNLGEARSRRPWFSVSWDISRRVYKDAMAQLIGEEFAGLFDTLKS